MPKTNIDYCALADFRYEIRRFLNFSERAARKAGIEPQQHQALLVIKGLREGLIPTVGVLAERLQIRHHSAVELMDRLENRRLIRRARRQADRREVVLTLTARGEKLLKTLTPPHKAELLKAGPKLIKALNAAMGGSYLLSVPGSHDKARSNPQLDSEGGHSGGR